MSTGLIDHLRELSAGLAGIGFKRMFGGWGMFCEGRMIGLIARDVFYLKSDAETNPAFDAEGLGHFEYNTKAGKHMQMGYRRLPERCLDDADEFEQWVKYGIAAASRAALKPANRARKAALMPTQRQQILDAISRL